MTADPGFSVVICTYSLDRWTDLARSVESVRAQAMAAAEIVLVVDHNDALLERAQANWPDLHVVPNREEAGLSGARNTGLALAKGEVIAFLDDDAAAEPNWIAELAGGYRDPDVVGVGGESIPLWDRGRPSWFPREFDWVVGCSYRGLPERAAPVRNFIGSNMSFRTHQLREVGGFNAALGRVGSGVAGCEETELCIRLTDRYAGARLMYEPRARVQHRVPASRGTWRYFRSRCFAEGRSKAIVSRLVGSGRGLKSERSYATRVLPVAAVRAVGDLVRTRRAAHAGQAAVIGAGLAMTALGYLQGIVFRPPLSR